MGRWVDSIHKNITTITPKNKQVYKRIKSMSTVKRTYTHTHTHTHTHVHTHILTVTHTCINKKHDRTHLKW